MIMRMISDLTRKTSKLEIWNHLLKMFGYFCITDVPTLNKSTPNTNPIMNHTNTFYMWRTFLMKGYGKYTMDDIVKWYIRYFSHDMLHTCIQQHGSKKHYQKNKLGLIIFLFKIIKIFSSNKILWQMKHF